jgi:hypothetical protein
VASDKHSRTAYKQQRKVNVGCEISRIRCGSLRWELKVFESSCGVEEETTIVSKSSWEARGKNDFAIEHDGTPSKNKV